MHIYEKHICNIWKGVAFGLLLHSIVGNFPLVLIKVALYLKIWVDPITKESRQ